MSFFVLLSMLFICNYWLPLVGKNNLNFNNINPTLVTSINRINTVVTSIKEVWSELHLREINCSHFLVKLVSKMPRATFHNKSLIRSGPCQFHMQGKMWVWFRGVWLCSESYTKAKGNSPSHKPIQARESSGASRWGAGKALIWSFARMNIENQISVLMYLLKSS